MSGITPNSKSAPEMRDTRQAKKQIIEVTRRALEQLHLKMLEKPGSIGVRLGVQNKGCAGQKYTFDYISEAPEGDHIIELRFIKAELSEDDTSSLDQLKEDSCNAGSTILISVEKTAIMHIIGTTLDFEETALKKGFVFHNPNAKNQCGCGESFST